MKKFLDVITLLAAIVGIISAAVNWLPVTCICGVIVMLDALAGLSTPESAGLFLYALLFTVLSVIIALVDSYNVFVSISLGLCIMVIFLEIVGLVRYFFKR